MLWTLALLFLALGVRVFINRGQTWGTPDEKTYTIYAKNWRPGAKYAEYVDRFLKLPPQVPPIRYGFIGICAAIVAALRTNKSFQVVTWVAAVSGALAAPLAYAITNDVKAALLVGSSPLSLALSRRALQDTFGALVILLALYAVQFGNFVLFTLALTLAVASREALLLYFPALFFAWAFATNRWLEGCAALTFSLALAIAGFYALGGQKLLMIFKKLVKPTEYVTRFQSGMAHRSLVDLALVSPLPLIAGLILIHQGPQWLAIFLLVSVGVHSWYNPKNVRFLLAVDAALRMFCAGPSLHWVHLVGFICMDIFVYLKVLKNCKDPVTFNLILNTEMYKEKDS